jgi:hypothetical protein
VLAAPSKVLLAVKGISDTKMEKLQEVSAWEWWPAGARGGGGSAVVAWNA